MKKNLDRDDLVRLVQRVFEPRETDRRLAVLVDLPDGEAPDHRAWSDRRAMAASWTRELQAGRDELGLEEVHLVRYRNVHSNNADFPADAQVDSDVETTPFDRVFTRYSILIAATEFSATAPLKLAARRYGFRAATMPGFNVDMIPALALDYSDVNRRCKELKALVDDAIGAVLKFEAGESESRLFIDLRHRTATASGGVLSEPGVAGNLPSGETYIVPYEGERSGDPSRTEGSLPLQIDDELLTYRIEKNRVVEVFGDGPHADSERRAFAEEPAYANVAELGLGVLAGYGVRPVGELLLDEKLGLHIAFGRSDHFGGQVGAKDFSSPDRVIHLDRVYIPEVQPKVRVVAVDLERPEGRVPLMRDGAYV